MRKSPQSCCAGPARICRCSVRATDSIIELSRAAAVPASARSMVERLYARRALVVGSALPCRILSGGGVSERPKEHASKACEVQASVGSNPTATAEQPRHPCRSAACRGARGEVN